MRTLNIRDMTGKDHEVDVTFVEDIVKALDDSRLLDDVIRAIPIARVREVLAPYEVPASGAPLTRKKHV